MLFADTSDTVWLAIIGVFALGVKEFFDWKRADKVAKKVEEVKVAAVVTAENVKEVKTALETTTSVQDSKLETIHTIVNSNNERLEKKVDDLTKRLEEALQREARQQGRAEGTTS